MNMNSKIRVKAAFVDKASSRIYENLTPVSTWVDPGATVADLLPTLTKRFWAVVASELLDDDEGESPQPEMVKAVSITYDGSLVLRDDNLYDVLADGSPRTDSDTPVQKDRTILVGIKGASDYLPAISKSASGKPVSQLQQQPQWKIASNAGLRHQGLGQSQPVLALPGGVADIMNVQFPVLQQSSTPSSSKPMLSTVIGGTSQPEGTGITTLDSAAWAGIANYPNIQLLQTSNDGSMVQAVPAVTLTGADAILGKRSAADRDGEDRECPLPFLRDISSVTELYERWEIGMDGQKPLKKLAPAQYRCYRTRYHEIKNFIFQLQERARNGEGDGDCHEVAKKMQAELEEMKTSHGTRMGLPTYVRQTASLHVQKTRTGITRSINEAISEQQKVVSAHEGAEGELPKDEQG